MLNILAVALMCAVPHNGDGGQCAEAIAYTESVTACAEVLNNAHHPLSGREIGLDNDETFYDVKDLCVVREVK